MPTLKTPFWDANGKLYRPGTEIPASAFGGNEESGASSGTAAGLDGLNFASDEASEAASQAGLTAQDFDGVEPSGANGYTKPDVRKIVDAKG